MIATIKRNLRTRLPHEILGATLFHRVAGIRRLQPRNAQRSTSHGGEQAATEGSRRADERSEDTADERAENYYGDEQVNGAGKLGFCEGARAPHCYT